MDRKQASDRVNQLDNVLNLIRRSKMNHSNVSGLKHSEIFFLLLLSSLNDGEPVTPSEVAEKLGVTMAAVTHHIKSLEKGGYVVRTSSPEDGRVSFVSLTAAGKEKVGVIKKEHRAKLIQLVEYLGDKDSAKLIYLVGKLSEFFKVAK